MEMENQCEEAQQLAKNWIRTRSGFGSFKHYSSIFQETVSLILESSTIAPIESLNLPFTRSSQKTIIHSPRDDRKYFQEDFHIGYKALFELFLSKPSAFDPDLYWSLFWALAKAEHRFMLRYTPLWSHEERLTGHFVSQIVEQLEYFGASWVQSNQSAQSSNSRMKIYYADTAKDNQEKKTGADFGLIVQASCGNRQEFIKAARFQVKKVDNNNKARIELRQVKNLNQSNSKIGYFLFYSQFDSVRWILPPIVRSSKSLGYLVEESRGESEKPKTATVEVSKNGWDFSSFVTFGLADLTSDCGYLASNVQDAVNKLMRTESRENLPPSRIIAISIGDDISVIDWNRLLEEYLG
ncbi:MAG: hypothetical protein WBA57_23305 [Elainellaceae cyanobacterium]